MCVCIYTHIYTHNNKFECKANGWYDPKWWLENLDIKGRRNRKRYRFEKIKLLDRMFSYKYRFTETEHVISKEKKFLSRRPSTHVKGDQRRSKLFKSSPDVWELLVHTILELSPSTRNQDSSFRIPQRFFLFFFFSFIMSFLYSIYVCVCVYICLYVYNVFNIIDNR